MATVANLADPAVLAPAVSQGDAPAVSQGDAPAVSRGDAPAVSRGNIVIPGDSVQRVLTTLENPAYRWHSLNALARETNLSPAVVRFVLNEIPSEDLVATPSSNGYLYTTRRHYEKTKTWKSRIFSVLSDLPK